MSARSHARRVLAMCVLGALSLASYAQAGAAAVDAEVRVATRQDQAGKVIRATAFVQTEEQLTVNGRARVRLDGVWRRLEPKGTPRELAAESGFNLKFRPPAELATDIAKALRAGNRPLVSMTVVLSTPDGRAQQSTFRVRLTR